MALEKLVHTDTFTISHYDNLSWIEARHLSGSEKMYRDLQNTPLYDREWEQWQENLNNDQTLGKATRWTESQLLGVLVEGLFHPRNAQRIYGRVKETKLFDDEHEQWRSILHKDQTYDAYYRLTRDQLYGVLVEGLFDNQKAFDRYTALKRSALYDRVRGQWVSHAAETSRSAESQLLGIWAESLFDKGKAYTQYEMLKKTNLYDSNTEEWLGSMNINQQVDDHNHYITDKLLDVIVEGVFEKQSAQQRYERMKQSDLYDPKTHQWLSYGLFGSYRTSEDQLLGVYIERMFEMDERVVFEGTGVRVPVVRRF